MSWLKMVWLASITQVLYPPCMPKNNLVPNCWCSSKQTCSAYKIAYKIGQEIHSKTSSTTPCSKQINLVNFRFFTFFLPKIKISKDHTESYTIWHLPAPLQLKSTSAPLGVQCHLLLGPLFQILLLLHQLLPASGRGRFISTEQNNLENLSLFRAPVLVNENNTSSDSSFCYFLENCLNENIPSSFFVRSFLLKPSDGLSLRLSRGPQVPVSSVHLGIN